MQVIALIDDAIVIRRILEHLGCWAPRDARQNQRAPPGDAKDLDGLKPPVRETDLPSRSRYRLSC